MGHSYGLPFASAYYIFKSSIWTRNDLSWLGKSQLCQVTGYFLIVEMDFDHGSEHGIFSIEFYRYSFFSLLLTNALLSSSENQSVFQCVLIFIWNPLYQLCSLTTNPTCREVHWPRMAPKQGPGSIHLKNKAFFVPKHLWSWTSWVCLGVVF